MKIKDLMMGDWIQSPITPKPLKVAQINWDYSVECVGIDDMIRYHVGLGDIKPIPLTPEILEKNGFKGSVYAILTLDEQSWLEYYFFEHRLRKIWSGVDEWQNHANVRDITFQCNCHYLHELQHALRLCGIEKEIII